MEKVVNYTVPKNNTFRQFYSITMFGVVFYHPSGLTERRDDKYYGIKTVISVRHEQPFCAVVQESVTRETRKMAL